MRGPIGFSAAEDKIKDCCARPPLGDRASISDWCSYTPTAPALGNEVRTRRRVPTEPDPTKRKKSTYPLLGIVYLLTIGDLIGVRPPARPDNSLLCNQTFPLIRRTESRLSRKPWQIINRQDMKRLLVWLPAMGNDHRIERFPATGGPIEQRHDVGNRCLTRYKLIDTVFLSI